MILLKSSVYVRTSRTLLLLLLLASTRMKRMCVTTVIACSSTVVLPRGAWAERRIHPPSVRRRFFGNALLLLVLCCAWANPRGSRLSTAGAPWYSDNVSPETRTRGGFASCRHGRRYSHVSPAARSPFVCDHLLPSTVRLRRLRIAFPVAKAHYTDDIRFVFFCERIPTARVSLLKTLIVEN